VVPASKKILVVEDDDLLREALAECIAGLGIAVVEARDGLEALEMMEQKGAPSAILLDVRMPRLDGEGFLQVLRSHPALAEIPVVTMSGGDHLEASSPVASQVRKPFDVDEVARLLVSLCEA
jgi:two-component system chemotaxis response regulator CheY